MTQGEPISLMLRFAIPMMIGSIFQSLYTMVDSAVLGRYAGSEALAAIGATTSTTGFILMFAMSVTNAISIVMSQYVGANDRVKVKQSLVSSMYILLFLGIVLGAVGVLFARPIMVILQTPANIIDRSVLYIQLICGCGLAQFAYNGVANVLRALGDSTTPLVFLILCAFLNVGLDLFAVIVLNMGVVGVAVATIGSQAVSAIICIIVMFRKFPELKLTGADMKPDKKVTRQIFLMGSQMAAQSAFLSIGMMVITAIINKNGSDIVAAFTVGSNIQNLAVVLFSGFSFGFSVYVGQNYGAKRVDRIKLGVKQIVFLVGGLSFIACFLTLIFADFLVSLYVKPEETQVVKASLEFLRVEAWFFPMLGWIWLYLSTLKGMGKISITFISSLIELGSKIGFSIVLPIWFGYVGIWWAAPLGWVLGNIPNLIYYYRGKWAKELESKSA